MAASSNSLWRSFLPWHVLQELSRHPEGTVGLPQRFDVVALFADISGFTAISEALGAAGRLGTEELTGILNRYFGPMIELIHAYGGTIGKFGGDAMTVLFPLTPHPFSSGEEEQWGRKTALRSLACALEMQAHMSAYTAIPTSAGTFSLAMKAGLAAGPVLCTLVGDPAVRLEYILAGEVLDRCAEAEHHAAPGEVVTHTEVLQLARGESTPSGSASPWVRVEPLRCPVPPLTLPPVGDLSHVSEQVAWGFIHPSIAERLRRGQASFINEHRRVTILFMAFTGFDYDHDPQAGFRLQDYLSRVFHTVAAYGGTVNKVDMGDKGSKVVILFGAPLAQEDDIQAALCCACDLVALPGATAAIGVNTGFVFCGQVGSEERREYTVMGDAVNLAARLMQKAQPGQVLVGEATHQSAASRFTWGNVIHTSVKGKQQPVAVYPLLGAERAGGLSLQEPRYSLPMVGRQNELEVARQRLELARQGRGQIVGITAEAGMGKSRLAAEVIHLALEASLEGYGGECLSHGTSTSYLVWRPILSGLFHLDGTQPLETQVETICSVLAQIEPGLERRAPLLSRPLGLPIAENDTTRSMDARLRKESLEDLVVTCVRHAARRKPLLLICEDYHWIDPLSADLLDTVSRNLAAEAALVLIVYRPLEANRTPPAFTLCPHFTEIHLNALTLEETRQLIANKLAQLDGLASAPMDLVTRINERAQGNPFFVDEMINWLHDHGWTTANAADLSALALPDSLHSLIISRIDQLEEAAKTTLKVASVIGRSFRASWLWGIFPEVGTPERVQEQLAQLSRLEITPLDRTEPELEYLFKHIITREVAYESLALATRQMLHTQAGRFIERTFADELERFVDLLAYHYGLSTDTAKQIEYFQKAAQAAQAAYANSVAVDYYQRLLPLSNGLLKANTLLSLGDLLIVMGDWDQAEQYGRQALTIATQLGDAACLAESQRLLGAIERHRGNYPQALTWLQKSRRGFQAMADEAKLRVVLREIGIVHWSQGEYQRALRHFRRCMRIAQALNDPHALSQALGNLSIVYIAQDDDRRALKYAQQGLKLAEQSGDRLGVSTFVGNMGTIYQGLGDYPRALDCFSRYLHLSQELGFRLGVSIAVGNIGNVYLDSGYPELALPCYKLNLKMARELGDQLGIAIALWSLAAAHLAQGDLLEAERLLLQAIELGRELDTLYELCDFLTTQATLYAQMERWEAAHQANQEALSATRSTSRQPLEFQAQLFGIWLETRRGNLTPSAAVEALKALETSMFHQDKAQLAAWHYTLWQVSGDETHRRQAAEAYRALYARTPNILYHQRYKALTGAGLFIPSPQPPLPEIVTRPS